MRRRLAVASVAAVVGLAVAQGAALLAHLLAPVDEDLDVAVPVAADAGLPLARTVDAYAGHGTWVDVYDFAPSMQIGGQEPAIGPDDLDEMATQGVRTLYLQAGHDRGEAEPDVIDADALAALLRRSHELGMRVVGWYLPRFADIERDLAYLHRIATWEAGGHRFDGVAVDIEWTESVPDDAERSARLVELSERLRATAGRAPIGAIVLPPVQLEDVNPDYWADFPWAELATLYDVWLPMGYWTTRPAGSPHRDGYGYTVDNVTRLRERLGDDDALVHPVGGIGDEATPQELAGYAAALIEVGAVGGSMYDWRTLDAAKRARLARDLAPDGAG